MSLTELFRDAPLEVEDLYLLESFQIAYLPGWVPEREFAALLWANPGVKAFLLKKHPPIAGFVQRLLDGHCPTQDQEEVYCFCEKVIWTIPDLLAYNRCPEVYDAAEFHHWDFTEVTDITPLDGKVVVDGGSGTGRVALEAAQTAKWVFAVEPVTRLRQFIRDQAAHTGLGNLYVVDGLLHAIPLPNEFADVLITSHALAWNLDRELTEFERVVKKGGYVIHCPGTAEVPGEEETHATLISSRWQYQFDRYRESDGWKRKYWKQV